MEKFLSITIIIAGTLWLGLVFAALLGKWILSLLSQPRTGKKHRLTEEADAIVLHIEQTGLYINNKPQVKLQVQVMPGKGRNFVTEINEVEVAGLKAGSVIRVLYNPRNYRELFLIKAA